MTTEKQELLIDTIVDHVVNTPFEAFSDEHIQHAKLRIIDALSCGVSGSGVEGNDAFQEIFQTMGGEAQSSLIGTGTKLPIAHAALVNSLQIRSFDFEVCGPEPEGSNVGKMVGHVDSTTQAVALSVAEFVQASGKEYLAAVILSGDVGARFAVSNRFNFDKDFEVCGTANAFGAVAAAGRLMKLTAEELKNAFALLLNLISGTYQSLWDGAQSFKMPGAMAAYNAVFACQLAQKGFKGPNDALESRLGYFNLFTPSPEPENLIAELGEIFYVRGQHKMHPSCYENHAAIESILELKSEHDFAVEDIEKVTAGVLPHRIEHFLNQYVKPGDPQAKYLFTMPYGVANVLLRGRPEFEHFVEPAINNPKVLELMHKVTLEPLLEPARTHKANALIVVTLKDGTVLEKYVDAPPGWLDTPVTEEDVIDKFWRNVNYAALLSEEKAQTAIDLIDDIENVDDVSKLAAALSQ